MIVGAALAAAGLALLLVGVLGWRRRLPRNRFAGVRTLATLRDDETFAVGNQVGAPLSIAAGGVAVLGGVALLAVPSVTAGWVVLALALVTVVVFTVAGGVLGDRAAARVPMPTLAGCSGVCTGCSLVEGCSVDPETAATPAAND